MFSRQHFQSDQPHRPHINCDAVLALKHLGCSVRKSTALGQHPQLLVAVAAHAGQLEIDDLEFASHRVVEDVFRLEVAVAHAFAVHVAEAVEQIGNDQRSAFFTESPVLAHELAQSGELAELHHDAASQFALIHEEELALDDGLVVELHQDLVVGPHVLEKLQLVLLAHLDRVGLASFAFSALKDLGLGSFSQFFSDFEELLKALGGSLVSEDTHAIKVFNILTGLFFSLF